MDLELDYMMAKGSNSGIYLQGRYEIQLFDIWGKAKPTSSDNGGIYERWDDSKPEGQQGYGGYAPRQNVSRAPGLWQHISISFQAPRFDDKGQKTANAKILYVKLNGVLIQENVELLGPTRGAVDNTEVATGPLRLQGDHGPVAFRNISINNFDKPHPVISNLKYAIYTGALKNEPDYKTVKPASEGTSTIISSNVGKLANTFLIRYTGDIHIVHAGEYTFHLSVPNGNGAMRINNAVAVTAQANSASGTIQLQAGDFPFDVFYSKTTGWGQPALGVAVTGPGIREFSLSDNNVNGGGFSQPVLIDANENTVLRSFIDLPGGIRVTHSVNVGSPAMVNYTYDLDKGMIVEIWRGNFLDASTMWIDRGDGSSRVRGSVQYFGKPGVVIEKLANDQAAWANDTTGTAYRPKGYILDADGRPAFRYLIYGSLVNDASTVLDGGQGIRREITMQDAAPNLYVRLASGNNIEKIKDGLYTIDDKSYYIRLEDAGNAKPVIRPAGSGQELIIPFQKKLTYSIIF